MKAAAAIRKLRLAATPTQRGARSGDGDVHQFAVAEADDTEAELVFRAILGTSAARRRHGRAARPSARMRAVVYDRYGPPDVLRVEDIPVPTPRAGQVLVEVVATSINRSDWEGLTGSPGYARIGGFRRPRRRVLGSDIAGRIAAVGPGVTTFRQGDEVYCDNLGLLGGFAEYAVAPEAALARKPKELTFVEASALPQAGAIALQGTASVRSGQRMLVNGAGGGSGLLAIQLAKLAGAHVTGVDNAGKLEFMRSVGADDVVDYRSEDFTRREPFDLVLDLVAGERSVFALRRSLAPGGRYLVVGGTVRALLRTLTVGAAIGRLTRRRLGLLIAREGPEFFEPIAERFLAGELRLHIDRTFPLEETPQALAHVGQGRALGKVVVTP
jgi:NADPH:quinone reductase-like Zn-dependent oxidoreductase